MYFPYFITYIAVGLILALVVFFWAVHNGQFKDQGRARFLPLEEDGTPAVAERSKFSRLEVYTLMILALAGLGASGAVLLFSLTAG
jgi:cbb3-type cytochrome oxidase maturation protein